MRLLRLLPLLVGVLALALPVRAADTVLWLGTGMPLVENLLGQTSAAVAGHAPFSSEVTGELVRFDSFGKPAKPGAAPSSTREQVLERIRAGAYRAIIIQADLVQFPRIADFEPLVTDVARAAEAHHTPVVLWELFKGPPQVPAPAGRRLRELAATHHLRIAPGVTAALAALSAQPDLDFGKSAHPNPLYTHLLVHVFAATLTSAEPVWLAPELPSSGKTPAQPVPPATQRLFASIAWKTTQAETPR